MPIIRLRRYGHDGCEHDIPIDVTVDSAIPDRGDRIAAPVEGEFILVIEKYRLESPVSPAVHSSETHGTPEWELRVLRLDVDELVNSAVVAVLMTIERGEWDTDEDDDYSKPLLN